MGAAAVEAGLAGSAEGTLGAAAFGAAGVGSTLGAASVFGAAGSSFDRRSRGGLDGADCGLASR